MIGKEATTITYQFHQVGNVLISEGRRDERGEVKVRARVLHDVLNLGFGQGKEVIAHIEIRQVFTLVLTYYLLNEFFRFANLEFGEHRIFNILVLIIKAFD